MSLQLHCDISIQIKPLCNFGCKERCNPIWDQESLYRAF